MKLQLRVLCVIVPVIVLPMVAVGYAIHGSLRDSSSERSLQQLSQLLDQARARTEERIRTTVANLHLFADSSLLEDYLLTADELQRYTLLQPTLLRSFSSYQRAHPEYEQIQLLLPDGFEDSRTTVRDLPNTSDFEQDTPFFRQLAALSAGSPALTALLPDPDTGQMVLKAGLPLHYRDPAREPVGQTASRKGYLVITVSLDYLRQFSRHARVGAAGRIRFLDGSGMPLFSSATGLQLPDLPALATAATEPGVWQQVEDPAGAGNVVFGGRIRHDLLVYGRLPEQQVMAASRQISRLVALVAIVITAVMTGLLLTFLRIMVIGPLTELRDATSEVGRGNLMTLVKVNRKDEIGELAGAFNRMIQDLISSGDKIRDLAYRDALTRLPNRRMLLKQLDQALSRAKRAERPLALMFLDVDNFKQINDLYGHEVGDQLLVHMASVLTRCLRSGDTVAVTGDTLEADEDAIAGSLVGRLGGDEFLLLLPEIHDIMDTEKVARRILEALTEPFRVGDTQIHIGTSIGITAYPHDGDNADTLMRNADMAMYHAKSEGKNNYQYFSQDLSRAVVERLDIENRLRGALEAGKLLPHYQPQFDVRSGRVTGAELLLRWHNDELGWVSPGDFIPIAEDSGLIVPITAWLLREAARQIASWNAAGLDYLTVSVNVSSIDVMRSNLPEMIASALSEHAITARQLAVELTETTIMTGHRKPAEALAAIKALGVSVYLDDFGTGYASLSYLSRFPFDKVKIDRSFVDGLPEDRENVAIVRAIIALARSLDMSITAEGVETIEQLQFLQREGCEDAQGWLFAKAMSAEDLAAALTRDPQRHPWAAAWQPSAAPALAANH